MKKLLFDDKTIFILAEIAQSYEGKKNVLSDIIEGLTIAKTNGIMFQVVYADELAVPDYDYYDLFKSLEMSDKDWKDVIRMIHNNNIYAVAEIFGNKSFDLMIQYDIDAVKLHASDITNEPLLKYVGKHDIPILLAIGGANRNEIKKAIALLNNNKEIILMHGYQKGPTPINDTHFNKISALIDEYSLPVGYSDHIAGFEENADYKTLNDLAYYFPFISVGSGVRLIEKHTILNRDKQWEDYESALTTKEFSVFVELIRKIENSTGLKTLDCNETEKSYRRAIKSIVAKKDIKKGTVIKEDLITFKRVNQKIKSIKNINDVIGFQTNKNIIKNEAITLDSIKA